MEGEAPMRSAATLLGAAMMTLLLAVPALALEDGVVETSDYNPNEDFTHADFDRVITNLTDAPIDIAPRDLRASEYPILTVTEITAGIFDDGIWTVGTLDAGQTARIAYTGDAAAATIADELPLTGSNDRLGIFAIVGFALIGLGASLLRAARD
jgi:LPXTG-motif cell wall-anchored protein